MRTPRSVALGLLTFAILTLLALAMLLWVNVPVASFEPSTPTPVSGFAPVTLAPPTDAPPPLPPETRPPIAVPTPVLVVDTRSIVGKASWYCNYTDRAYSMSVCHYRYPDKAGQHDMYAAACAKLRAAMGPNWRGKTVTVTGNGTWVKVKLIDYCASEDKTIDLYRDAADVLGYTGILRVTVSW